MIINPFFEIVDIADEYMAVPIGELSESFRGIVALNEAAAFLLRQMQSSKTENELVELLVGEYQVDRMRAKEDVTALMGKLVNLGVVTD